MGDSSVKRIIDFFERNPGIDPELRAKFEQWVLEHSEDEELCDELWRRWTMDSTMESLEETALGLERLNNGLADSRRRKIRHRIHRIASVAALVVAVFVLGFFVSTFFNHQDVPETNYVLATSTGNTGHFELPDGTHVWLNTDSRIEYEGMLDGDVRIVRLVGEGYFEVAKNAERPFRVQMNDMVIEVLGTSFDARCYPDANIEDVVLRTGSVKVLCPTAPQEGLTLTPGQKFAFDHRARQTAVSNVNADNYCRWFSPRLVFDNTPLSDILANLERRYNAEIEVGSAIQMDKRLSLTVSSESAEEIMAVMSRLLDADCVVSGNTLSFGAR